MLLDRKFTAAELSALRLDGDAFALYDSTLSLDSPDVLATRVALARGNAPERMVIDRLSAAWAWRATQDRPEFPMICADLGARSSKQLGQWAPHKTYRFTSEDVVQTSGGPVLSLWRTLLHVLRFDAEQASATLDALIHLNGLSAVNLASAIRARTGPKAQRTYLARLAELDL